MSCFDSTHAPFATAARAARTGLVSMSTRPDIPGMLHLEREARDWSTYNEYSYRIILLLLYVPGMYIVVAHIPISLLNFGGAACRIFFTFSANSPKSWWEGHLVFLCGRQVHFLKRTFTNTLLSTIYSSIYSKIKKTSPVLISCCSFVTLTKKSRKL